MAESITFAGEVTAKPAPDATSTFPIPSPADPNDTITILVEQHATVSIQLVDEAGDEFGILIPAGNAVVSIEGFRAASDGIPNILKAASEVTVQVTVVT